ncbi:MAG: uracil-DNA glycosylase [Nitrospirota bacterium]
MNKREELSKIAREIEACDECREQGSGRAVTGEGNPDAAVMFVGEAPGKEEAKTGRPFVGRSGRLLRSLIREIGLTEDEVFITNPVYYLPKRGTPSRESIRHSRAHFMKQLGAVDPEIVVLLGSVAGLAALGSPVAITKQHGSFVHHEGRTYFISFHPSAALRFPGTKELFEEDFKKLKALIRAEAQRHES